jgi:hypothetical protein
LGLGDPETAKQIADHLAKIGMKMTYSITANRKGVVSDSIKISYVKQPQKKEEPKKTEPKKPATDKPMFIPSSSSLLIYKHINCL